jgi:hypothetical protein
MNGREYLKILEYLAQTPRKIATLVDPLSAAALLRRPAPDAFCALEQVCHLRDIEREGYEVRVRRILQEDRPALQNIDGARLAIERDYRSQDLAAALADFTAARGKSVRLLRETTPAQRMRTGNLDGSGACSLYALAEMMRLHDREHIAELEAIRGSL